MKILSDSWGVVTARVGSRRIVTFHAAQYPAFVGGNGRASIADENGQVDEGARHRPARGESGDPQKNGDDGNTTGEAKPRT